MRRMHRVDGLSGRSARTGLARDTSRGCRRPASRRGISASRLGRSSIRLRAGFASSLQELIRQDPVTKAARASRPASTSHPALAPERGSVSAELTSGTLALLRVACDGEYTRDRLAGEAVAAVVTIAARIASGCASPPRRRSSRTAIKCQIAGGTSHSTSVLSGCSSRRARSSSPSSRRNASTSHGQSRSPSPSRSVPARG